LLVGKHELRLIRSLYFLRDSHFLLSIHEKHTSGAKARIYFLHLRHS
jgi:hypothetical protein